MGLALGLAIGLLLAPALAGRVADQPVAPAGPGARVLAQPAEIVRVLDGDTFDARLRIWPGLEMTTRVRLRGVDAPEFSAQCATERRAAEAARSALARLLAGGDVAVANVTLDKYGGRVIATVSTGAEADVARALIAAGVARPYAGGRRAGWCDADGGDD